MTGPIKPLTGQGTAAADDAKHAKLRKASKALEAVFVNELFKVMRETVPTEGGFIDQAEGQDLFQGMMDERVAGLYTARSHGGLGDALYRQLSRHLATGQGKS